MHFDVDLEINLQTLNSLHQSKFFDPSMRQYLAELTALIKYVQSGDVELSDAAMKHFNLWIWTALKYISGTASNNTPLEMQICLREAAKDWLTGDVLFTTALLEDKDFHFLDADIWSFADRFIPDHPIKTPRSRLIQIGLPRAYRTKPLYCIPLYHELGHFVDSYHNITDRSLLYHEPPQATDHAMERNHRCEFFADIFAASFCGGAIAETLKMISIDDAETWTHPPTSQRIEVISAFLDKSKHPITDIFQDTLSKMRMSPLQKAFSSVDLVQPFKQVRTVIATDDRELHGLFSAGWIFMKDAREKKLEDWALSEGYSDLEVEEIINNLVEKSIRNFDVVRKWRSAVPA